MEDKTKGAWVLHHLNKLENVTTSADYENIVTAGKMGTLLSALSATDDDQLSTEQVHALAKAARISVFLELPSLLELLKKRHLISCGRHGVDVLGVTSASTLSHTANAFDSLEPTPNEQAALDLAETSSRLPIDNKQAAERLGDKHKLSKKEVTDFLTQSEEIGFVDAEDIEPGRKLYFNGNLFRRESVKKIEAVTS